MLSYLNLNETVKQLKKAQAKLIYLERQYARMKKLERKQDTRRKIQLGGLVKKAELDEEPTAVIYGLLLEAKERLVSSENGNVRNEWKIRGDLALTDEQEH